MKILKKCLTCGADFIATKMSSKYCCRSCERVAQRRRESEKRKLASEKLLEFGGSKIPSELENKQFLTPKNLQDLLGVSRATIYRYFEFGIIKAVRIRQRRLVRRSDLEAYFDTASPYKKRSNKRKADKEYYSLKEIMENIISDAKLYGTDVIDWEYQKCTKAEIRTGVRRLLTQSLPISYKRLTLKITIPWRKLWRYTICLDKVSLHLFVIIRFQE